MLSSNVKYIGLDVHQEAIAIAVVSGALFECFNPACRKELRYLQSGRVVRVLRQRADRVEVEHFWLCGACYVSYDFRFNEEGNPTLGPKPPRWKEIFASGWTKR